jgi:transposase
LSPFFADVYGSSVCAKNWQLHWVTLPKGSPDDNPVETIFSDIQLMVLDNSNDPDVKTTQRRISRHLRRCNRRKNRWIHIPYWHGVHKDSVTNTSTN